MSEIPITITTPSDAYYKACKLGCSESFLSKIRKTARDGTFESIKIEQGKIILTNKDNREDFDYKFGGI